LKGSNIEGLNALSKKEGDKKTSTFVEAVEILHQIASFQPQEENFEFVLGGKTISDNQLIHTMKGALVSILEYLRKLKMGDFEHVEGYEGAHTVMELVEKAVKKTDLLLKTEKNDALSIKKFREYIDLKMYFRQYLARDLGEGVIQKWLSKISKGIEQKRYKDQPVDFSSKYMFVDLERVQKDRDYDLFYIRKEDGSRFFSSQLLKSMKLVYDVQQGEKHKEQKNDYYTDLDEWKEKRNHLLAAKLHSLLGTPIQQFFSQVDRELPTVKKLSQAFMALMLASLPKKQASASKYLRDFYRIFGEVLSSSAYQRVIKKDPLVFSEEEKIFVEIIIRICRAIMVQIPFPLEMREKIEEIAQKSVSDKLFSEQIKEIHGQMLHIEKHHIGLIIEQTLKDFEEGDCNSFDPLQKGNIPEVLFTLYRGNQATKIVRSPLPIVQSMIQKAFISDLFSGYLLGGFFGIFETKHLMISSLNSTLWKDYARASSLQKLVESPKGKEYLFILTLPKQSDFYEQKGPYASVEDAENFFELFAEQLTTEGTGYAIPEKMRKIFSSSWALNLLRAVWDVFLKKEKTLNVKKRMLCIDIVYLLLALKACEVFRPTAMNFQNSDGLDASLVDAVLLASLTAAINGLELASEQKSCLLGELFLPGLMLRSRGVYAYEMKRGIEVLEVIEKLQQELGAANFGKLLTQSLQSLYSLESLHLDLLFPKEA